MTHEELIADLTDLLATALTDSMDLDWTVNDGARGCVEALLANRSLLTLLPTPPTPQREPDAMTDHFFDIDPVFHLDTTTPRYRTLSEGYIYSQQGPALLRALSCLADSLIDSPIGDFDDPELEQALDEACAVVREVRGILDRSNDYNTSETAA